MPEMTLADFAVAVARYRDITSASVTSWGRTYAKNLACNGIPLSRHLVDLAVDVVYDEHLAEHIALAAAKLCGLHLTRRRGYDHLEPLTQGGPSNAGS